MIDFYFMSISYWIICFWNKYYIYGCLINSKTI